jgi:serine/threonine-protein kinase ULK4
VLNILEALAAHSKGLASAPDLVVDNLLPVLLRLKNSSDNDLKFRCFKLFSDILITYLYEEAIYDPNLGNKPVTRKINDLVSRALLPEYRDLLGETDPIPLYALKLLSAILERNTNFVPQLKKLALINMIIENFEGGNPRLNLHLISVVKKIIESHEMSIEELGQMGVIDRVSSVMRVIQEQDWCVEKMLDILFELLTITTDTMRNKRNDQSVIKITEPLCENFVSCTKILGFINEPVLVI